MFLILSALLATIDFSPTSQRVLHIDNEQVRVWKTTIAPFAPLKMHRHEMARVVIATKGGTLRKITDQGVESQLVFETDKAYWLEADPQGELHADVNEGRDPIEVFVIEIK